jgi:hypothetical protein
MIRQKERGPAVAPASPRSEVDRLASFSGIVPQQDAHSKYREVRAQMQADFMAYREQGGDLDATRWMYHYRPELFNLWVSCNSRGGQYDRRPMGRTRRDGERMVRGW